MDEAQPSTRGGGGLVAVLTDEYAPYQQHLVEAIAEVLDAAGFATLCVNGRELDPPDRFHQRFTICNQIFALIEHSNVDGVLCLSGTLARQGDRAALERFVERFTVPLVSIGYHVPGTASVTMREHTATQALMQHLLEDDRREHFAFVRGYATDGYSLEREAIFSAALHNATRPVQAPHYVVGDYDAFTTYRAVSDLLDRHPQIDTIVAANDTMALSAARAVTASGRRIPRDVAVTGFDDTPEATKHSPPLTTVRHPIARIAEQAARSLIACMAGERHTGKVEELAEIDAELVVRGSTFSPRIDRETLDRADADTLTDLLHVALTGLQMPRGIDLDEIALALLQTLATDGDQLASCLRRMPVPRGDEDELHWWSSLCDRIESLALLILEQRGQPRRNTTIIAALSQRRERLWAARMEQEFAERRSQVNRADMQLEIGSCTTPEQIVATLGRWMSNLKPRRAYVVRFDGPADAPPEHAALLHCYFDGVAQPGHTGSFATRQLLPDSLSSALSHGTLVLNPLYAGDALFGYLMIDPTGISLARIDSAAHSIGNAMRNKHLFQALERQAETLNETNAELVQLANFDTLTGLPNRRQFQQRLDSACAQPGQTPFALCFLDLDGFKQVNDTWGHKAGDLLLREVARRIQHTLSTILPNRAFVARLGGDEFTALIEGIRDAAELRLIAESILVSLARPYDLEGSSAMLSASIGAALFPGQAATASHLLRQADEAMYAAKSAGKNRFVLHDLAVETADRHRPGMVDALERALNERTLRLQLQPRIDLLSGAVEAVEGLMRWHADPGDPATTLTEPDLLIALAEQSGLIGQLECQALDQACRIARGRLDDGVPLPVSVTISGVSWREGRVVAEIESALLAHGLPGCWLEIELGEAALASDLETSLTQSQRLRSLGISIAINGFGTRPCSIDSLARLPISRVKIDPALLHAIDATSPSDSAPRAAYRAVVALTRSLGLRTVAVGVEIDAQQRLLVELGCEAAQGPYYGRAIGATWISGALATSAVA